MSMDLSIYVSSNGTSVERVKYILNPFNNNNKYLYSALSCVTQSVVTQNECNTI